MTVYDIVEKIEDIDALLAVCNVDKTLGKGDVETVMRLLNDYKDELLSKKVVG